MNKKDLDILERYAEAIFGCCYDDLDDKEQQMLIAHVQNENEDFMNHHGII